MNSRMINSSVLVLIGCLMTGQFFGCENTSDEPDRDMETVIDPNFHIYLCFGESNMEDSSVIEAQDRSVDDRLQILQPVTCSNLKRAKNSWYPAILPLSQCNTGLSPADYFGRTMVENLASKIPLIQNEEQI